ncbi:MAG TPA: radical SAM protein [Desulfatiglandales bacterium]|nr:radical SAM protein [Desulfatiglandales bacterium]
MKKGSYSVRLATDKAPLWKKKGPLLERLDMEITERCNNNCIHCFINLPAEDALAKEKELKSDDIKEILEQAASLGCLTVRFTGGEPVLREDFEDLYIFSRKLGLKVILFTNATLVTPKLAELLTRIPPLEMVEVSIYGMKKRSYEAVTRIPGSFEAAWQGISLLLEKKIPFVVKTVVLPPNRDDMEDFEQWAATIPWMKKSHSYVLFLDNHGRHDMLKRHMINKLRLSPEEGLKILTNRKNEYVEEMKGFCAEFLRPLGERVFSCGAGIGSGCVDAYGYFQPCLLLRHPSTVYNLRNGSLKDALTQFFPGVREMKGKDSDFLEHCAHCFLRGLCEQCPAKSWMEYGTLDTPVKYFCDIAHAQARFLGLLEDGEKAWEVKGWKERIRQFSEKTPALPKELGGYCKGSRGLGVK